MNAIRSVLLAGSQARHPGTNRPLFAFRLHQFLSKGDTVYVSIEPESTRHVTGTRARQRGCRCGTDWTWRGS